MHIPHLLRAALVVSFSFLPSAIGSERPNLLLVITDEHNFRTLGCYRDQLQEEQARMWGETVVDTPHIDWLAENGAIFNSMYASSPVCTPSRASMFTGHYPQNTGAHRNDLVMDTSIPTIATVLAKNGYATGYSGKWHLSGESKPGWDPQPNYGFNDNRYMFNRGHWKKLGLADDGAPYVASRNQDDQPSYLLDGADERSYTTDWLTNRALEFIEENKANPFFYVLSIPDPHGPNTVRQPYDEQFSQTNFEFPRTWENEATDHDPAWRHPDGRAQKNFQEVMQQYHGMVKCIDDNIGRLAEKLKAVGLLDNTIVVFSSDHGDLCGEHCRINKGVPLEGSARIPFIIYYPESVPNGTVVNAAANTTDWMDTFLSLMKIEKKNPTEGRDLTPLLTDQTPKDWDDITFVRSTAWVGAFTDRHKLIIEKSDKKPWLIDLETDPDELINQIDSPEYTETLNRLAKKLMNYGRERNDPTVLSSEVQFNLRAIVNRNL